MRTVITIFAAFAVVASANPVFAKGNPQMKACAAQWKTTPHTGTTYKAFMASCLHAGAATPAPGAPTTAPTPAPVAAPAAAMPMATKAAPAAGAPTAKCKDGTLSYSAHHSGSCSHHGGVASFM